MSRPRNPGQFQPHKIVNGRVVKDPRRNLKGRPGAKDKEPRMMRCLRCGYRNSKSERRALKRLRRLIGK